MTFVFSINAFRSSHQRCSTKKLLLKIYQYSQKTPVLESLFNKETPTWMFFYEYCKIFKNAYFGEHLGTDAVLCFPVSNRNFLCYFRKNFNFSMLKTPTMNLLHFILFSFLNIFSFIRTPLSTRHIKKEEPKQPSRNR